MKLSTFELRPLQLPVCGLDVGKSRRPGMAGSSHNNFSYCSSRNVTSLTSEHSLEHWTSTSGSKMFGLRLLCSAKKGAKSCRKDLQIAASMVGYREAPSCIFVGPIETAEKARLEALYQQVWFLADPGKSSQAVCLLWFLKALQRLWIDLHGHVWVVKLEFVWTWNWRYGR